MRRRSGGPYSPGPSTTPSPIVIVPASGRSKPAISRSGVFPLPDGPRMAVRDPAGTSRSTPVSTGCTPKALYRPETASCRMSLSLRILLVLRVGRAIEETAEHVAGHGRDDDHHQGERRRLAVGEVRLIRPELR